MQSVNVAPFAGAWIEMSHGRLHPAPRYVAPFAGAWIEIGQANKVWKTDAVAPFAGAWIEICGYTAIFIMHESLPSRERGLKCLNTHLIQIKPSRSLRGSVD